MKITKVRSAMIGILEKTSSPLSITEVLDKLSKKGLDPNKTTIYREIEFLTKEGMVKEVDFGEGKKRYEGAGEHHHHIVCIKCKTVKDVHIETDLDSFNAKVAKEAGYKPAGHSLEFFGVCKKCQ